MRLLFAVSFAFLASAGVITSCHANPSIDGRKVPPIGSEAAPPACPELCNRLAALCGKAPEDCVAGCADFDDGHRVCVGQAASCQEALQSCENAPEEEAGTDASSEEDAGEQEAGEEDAGDEDASAGDDAGDASSD